MLDKVRLFAVMIEFKKYRRSNAISVDQLKKSMHNVIADEAAKNGRELTDNDEIRIEQLAKKVIKVFDTNKNGKLEFQEAVSAFCALCKGSIQSKIKFLMLAYSEQVKEVHLEDPEPSSLTIKFKNLVKFIHCVFKLALESTSEIMLDYDLKELAKATAKKLFDASGADENGTVNLEQVCRFIETTNTAAIFASKAKD